MKVGFTNDVTTLLFFIAVNNYIMPRNPGADIKFYPYLNYSTSVIKMNLRQKILVL